MPPKAQKPLGPTIDEKVELLKQEFPEEAALIREFSEKIKAILNREIAASPELSLDAVDQVCNAIDTELSAMIREFSDALQAKVQQFRSEIGGKLKRGKVGWEQAEVAPATVFKPKKEEIAHSDPFNASAKEGYDKLALQYPTKAKAIWKAFDEIIHIVNKFITEGHAEFPMEGLNKLCEKINDETVTLKTLPDTVKTDIGVVWEGLWKKLKRGKIAWGNLRTLPPPPPSEEDEEEEPLKPAASAPAPVPTTSAPAHSFAEADAMVKKKDYRGAIKILQSIADGSNKNPLRHAKANYELSLIYGEETNIDVWHATTAVEYRNAAIESYKEIVKGSNGDSRQAMEAYNDLAAVYFDGTEKDNAKECVKKAWEIAVKIGEQSVVAENYRKIVGSLPREQSRRKVYISVAALSLVAAVLATEYKYSPISKLNNGDAIKPVKEAIEEGDYKEAEKRALEVINKNLNLFQKHKATLHSLYGEALYRQEKYQEAIAAFNESLKFDPMYLASLSKKASALIQLGKHQEAIEPLEKVVKLDPKDATAWHNLGVSHDALEQKEEALKAYLETVALNKKNAIAWNRLGYLHAQRKEYKKAINAFREELNINPEDYAEVEKVIEILKKELKKEAQPPAGTKPDKGTYNFKPSLNVKLAQNFLPRQPFTPRKMPPPRSGRNG